MSSLPISHTRLSLCLSPSPSPSPSLASLCLSLCLLSTLFLLLLALDPSHFRVFFHLCSFSLFSTIWGTAWTVVTWIVVFFLCFYACAFFRMHVLPNPKSLSLEKKRKRKKRKEKKKYLTKMTRVYVWISIDEPRKRPKWTHHIYFFRREWQKNLISTIHKYICAIRCCLS